MTDINILFFDLIRVVIGNQVCLSHTPSADEWGELYAMAKKQSLVGVCFAGVQKLQAQRQAPNSWGDERGEMLYLQWMGMAAKIQQRNEVVNRQFVDLQKQLSADGFCSCILKGQGIASLYGKLSKLRQPGDIDVWMNGGWEKVMNYVNERSPNREFDMKHTHYEFFADTVVEMHWRPAASTNQILNRKLTTYFEREKDRQFDNRVCLHDGQEVSAPTIDFQLVHAIVACVWSFSL